MDKIHVLQVIGAMNRAGAETVVMNLMRCIDRNRVHFDFLVHTDRQCDFDEEIEKLGGTIYRLPRYAITNGASYRRGCRRLFEEHRDIQVVHGHIGSCSAIYLDEARKAGCSTIAHSHRDSPKPTNLKAAIRRAVYGRLVRNLPEIADELLACSLKAGIDRFGQDAVGGAHFHIMRNGIDTTAFSCDAQAHEKAKEALGFGGTILIGNIARLAPEKNQEFLLQAFARMSPHLPSAKLVLVGRGPLEQELRNRAAQLGIERDVVFLGVRDDVPEVLKALDLFVFPSTVEGLPLITVEAQAAGVPCIVSTAVPEEAVVTNLVQRISLEEGIDEWAAHMVALAQASLPRTDTSGLVRAGGYDIKDVADWMTGFYAELARKSARGREGGTA